MAIARETGVGYIGPAVLAELARTLRDPAERRRLLDQGMAMLANGSISHSHFNFHRESIETALDMGDWDAAGRFADALEDYTRAEPLPWSTLFINRGRLLIRYYKGDRSDELRRQMADILSICCSVGLVRHTARLQATLED
jgi:hypothetical protein